jgi:uncharacterized protein
MLRTVFSERSQIKALPGLTYIKVKDKALLIDRESGSWLISDQFTSELARELSSSMTFEEVCHRHQNNAHVVQSLESLYDAYLISIDGKSRNLFKPSILSGIEPSEVILNLTHGCNLRCQYCYVNATTGPKMSNAIAKATIDKILSQKPTYFRFDLHGGEPTLEWSLIEYIVSYAKERSKDLGKEIDFSITTNATLLDEKKVIFLKENGFRVGVSIDGPREIHERNRYYGNGNGSFVDVMRGIKILQKYDLPFHVIAVITNPQEIKSIFDFFISEQIYSMRLLPYVYQGRAVSPMLTESEQEHFVRQDLQILRQAIELNRESGLHVKLLHISSMFRSILSWEQMEFCKSPLGPACNLIAVFPNGDIYPCNCLAGSNRMEEFKIGNITSPMSLENILAASEPLLSPRQRNVDEIEKCSGCAWKRICGGGDFNESFQAFGELNRESYMCTYYKRMYTELTYLLLDDPEGVLALLTK